MTTTAIILAAGQGTRLQLGYNKMFYTFEESILSMTIKVFEKHDEISNIILVVHKNEREKINDMMKNNNFKKIEHIVIGGETRQDSCYNGVQAVKNADIILIHDGSRPFVSEEIITQSIKDSWQYGASVVGVPMKDTVKIANKNALVEKTLDRSTLWLIQTPQTFKADIIKKAHEAAKKDNFLGTDDTTLAERLGYPVKIVKGDYQNIKIATKEDIYVAEKILKNKITSNF